MYSRKISTFFILQALFIDFAGDTKYILHIPKEEYERIYVNEMFKQ